MGDVEIKKIFSKNLNRLMALHNKNQKDISDDLGYHRATVSKWVRGAKYPRMDKVERLAQYFQVQISELIDDTKPDMLITKQDETDIAQIIEQMRERLTRNDLTFEGKPVKLDDIQSILSALQVGMEMARKRINEKK